MTPGALGDAAGAFTILAAEVFRHAGTEALRTKGAFEGTAGAVLSLALAMGEAGRSAFQALAMDPALEADERVAAMQVAGGFAEVCGILATRFGSTAQLSTTAALSTSAGLAAALAPEEGPVAVRISSAGQAALDSLRRDPLALAADLPSVRLQMAGAVAGIGVIA